jgi:aldehyde:ferredoxin oxidoreductase
VADLSQMLGEYYQLRGWDEDGVPLPQTLARLNL